MSNILSLRLGSLSLVQTLGGVVLALALVYVALIAAIMNYATLAVGFAQSVRDDEAKIAQLESAYFSLMTSITTGDYAIRGYVKPVAEAFVPAAKATALR